MSMPAAASVIFAAEHAAFESMPAESRALIEAHDGLFKTWRESGFSSPMPEPLKAARKAIEADPIAEFSMELRRRGNEARVERSAA